MDVEKELYRKIGKELSDFSDEDQELGIEKVFKEVVEEKLEDYEVDEKESKEIKQRVSFYLSALSQQKMYFDPEANTEDDRDEDEYDINEAKTKEAQYFPPPWFIPIPLLGEGTWFFQLKSDGEITRRNQKIDVDFLLNYTGSNGFAAPSLIKVASNEPEYKEVTFQQWLLSVRIGFIYQVAYPKGEEIGFNGMEDWAFVTPCPHCKNFSETVETCSECEDQIYPHTISSNKGGVLGNIQNVDEAIFEDKEE